MLLIKLLFKLLNVFFYSTFIASLFLLCAIMATFYFGPGRHPEGLKLGIANYEEFDCSRFVHENASYKDHNDDCIFTHASCHFINEIRDNVATKIFYNSFDQAFQDAKKGKLIGVIAIKANFSNALKERIINYDENAIESSEISVYLDQSDLQITTFLQSRLYKAFQRFNKKLLKGCNHNEKVGEFPLKFETPIYGTFDGDFKISMMPVFLFQLSELFIEFFKFYFH